MDAAVLGALFFLSLFGPIVFAGGDVFFGLDSDSTSRVVLGLIGAGGVGALLQLTGNAFWEILTPYGAKSGVHILFPNQQDFRAWIADHDQSWTGGDEAPKRLRQARERIERIVTKRGSPAWQRGHDQLATTELLFYSKAPEAIVGWCQRRYQRFVSALMAATAIVLGCVLGWYFLPYAEVTKLLLFDAALITVAVLTMAWAVEARRLAQAMEQLWFAVTDTTPAEDDKLTVQFDSSKPLEVHPNLFVSPSRERVPGDGSHSKPAVPAG
jgi:hypothetical protein